jgi:hypothetical protein
MLEAVVKKNEASIMKDTLTEKVLYNESKEGYTDLKINGEDLKIDVEKI